MCSLNLFFKGSNSYEHGPKKDEITENRIPIHRESPKFEDLSTSTEVLFTGIKVIEEEPQGVAYALNLARPHVEGSRLMVYFSDNITTADLIDEVAMWKNSEDPPGCLLLGRAIDDPRSFGVGVFFTSTILIILVSVSIFGLLLFVFVKNYIKNNMNSPVEQFTIKTIYELDFMGIDLSFTNASLFMMLSIFGSVCFLYFGSRK